MGAPASQGAFAKLRRRAADMRWHTVSFNTLTVFMLVMALAAILRFYRLTEVPNNLTADETDFLRDAYMVLEGRGPGVFSQGQTASVGPFGTYSVAWSLRFFGDSVFGLRMYSVLTSMAVLAVFFVLARHRFSLYATFVSTTLFATSIPALNFSRTAWANMNAAFVAILICCSLLLAIETRRFWLFAVAGLATGAAVWAYLSARLLPFVVAAFFPFAIIIYSTQRKRVIAGFVLAGAISLVIALPVLRELRTNEQFEHQYTERAKRVSIFDGRTRSEAFDLVPDNIVRTFRGYILLTNDNNNFRRSTEGARYAPRDQELFDPLTRVLFWTGLAAGVVYWRKTILWWLIFGGSLVSQVFSVGTPDAARGVVALPVLFLFIGLGAEAIVRSVDQGVRSFSLKVALASAGALAVAGVALINADRYFQWMESPYALEERGPFVTADEFDVWSRLQHAAISQSGETFNTGAWREAQDRGGCFTGWVGAAACPSVIEETPPALALVLPRPAELPHGFRQHARTELDGDTYREVQGGRNDVLRESLAGMDATSEAWAVVYHAPGVTLTANVARFSSALDARAYLDTRISVSASTFLGGPQSERPEHEPLGDRSLLEHFWLGDAEWWEYIWQEGPYLAQVQAMYFGHVRGTPFGFVEPSPLLDELASTQAQRIKALP